MYASPFGIVMGTRPLGLKSMLRRCLIEIASATVSAVRPSHGGQSAQADISERAGKGDGTNTHVTGSIVIMILQNPDCRREPRETPSGGCRLSDCNIVQLNTSLNLQQFSVVLVPTRASLLPRWANSTVLLYFSGCPYYVILERKPDSRVGEVLSLANGKVPCK